MLYEIDGKKLFVTLGLPYAVDPDEAALAFLWGGCRLHPTLKHADGSLIRQGDYTINGSTLVLEYPSRGFKQGDVLTLETMGRTWVGDVEGLIVRGNVNCTDGSEIPLYTGRVKWTNVRTLEVKVTERDCFEIVFNCTADHANAEDADDEQEEG